MPVDTDTLVLLTARLVEAESSSDKEVIKRYLRKKSGVKEVYELPEGDHINIDVLAQWDAIKTSENSDELLKMPGIKDVKTKIMRRV
jgi:hypothetical protein